MISLLPECLIVNAQSIANSIIMRVEHKSLNYRQESYPLFIKYVPLFTELLTGRSLIHCSSNTFHCSPNTGRSLIHCSSSTFLYVERKLAVGGDYGDS